ncbi:MAG: acyl-CoA synthetase [Burkholderiales bacterium]|nr:acyl-CoA synthetase [Burkholderiales bacterium]
MTDFIALEDLLARGRASDTVVAYQGDQALDFAAFALQVAGWQTAFRAAGGRRWALYFNDTATFAAALLGAWHAGVCAYLPADTLPATLATLQSEVDGFAGDVPAHLAPLASQAVPAAHQTWGRLDAGLAALVVYTSGSTGQPSAIPKRLAQLSSEVRTLAHQWDDALGNCAVVATVSHQHIYGLLFRVLWPLASGRPFLADRLAYAEDIVAALRCRAAALVASPAHLKRLPDTLDWAAARNGLRMLFSSGGPLPDDALADCRHLLQAPIEVYGSSETGGIAWRQRVSDDQLRWQPFDGVDIQAEGGCLQVRSPNLPNGDWYESADRVELADGGFTLLGRADRVVKIEERRVSLTAMEQVLSQSHLLRKARVICLPGRRVEVGVVAVPSDTGWALHDAEGKRALNQALRALLARVVEASALPRRWRYNWALPQNATGKTTEAGLLALFDPRRPVARLLAHSADAAQLQIDIAPNMSYFDGHFAMMPVLPGVAQIEWVVLFARELFALPPRFLRMDAVKFQQLVRPDDRLTMDLRLKATTTTDLPSATLTFSLTSAAGTHASGRLVFADEATAGGQR